MIRRSALFVVLLLVLGTSFSCRSFGDPIMKIKGVVKDSQNNPVEGVTVQILGEMGGEVRKQTTEQITKADGEFNFSIIGRLPDKAWITFNKEGFKSEKKDLSVKDEKETIVNTVLQTN